MDQAGILCYTSVVISTPFVWQARVVVMRVYIGLGSNIGDRAGQIAAALGALQATDGVEVVAFSHLYETEPVGELDQPRFLNLAAVVETVLEPLEVLEAAKAIERRLGRQRRPRWGPREIDIDLILWEGREMASEMLTLPHPEFRTRAFVLAPLAEIAPDAVDPVTGMTVAALARSPAAQGHIEKRHKLAPTP